MEKTIHYGMGSEYLSTWTLEHALREIYQNFLDYGLYYDTSEFNGDTVLVTLTNNWKPESLDFLRIGLSIKKSENAIGKHGEGLKMAFMILQRLGYGCKLYTPKYEVWPDYYEAEDVGKCFCLRYKEHYLEDISFKVEFECDPTSYEVFKSKIIKSADVIFSDGHYGEIVNKPAGEIYSGGLYVAKLKNVSKAYNINPKYLPLDRDRLVPGAFDTSWATSKINEAYGKWSAKDVSYSDTQYVSSVPEEVKKEFKPILVNKKVEFFHTDEKGEKQILKNDRVKELLKEDSFFEKAIKRLKKYVAKKLGVYDMLIEFQNSYKYQLSKDALDDLTEIIDKVK